MTSSAKRSCGDCTLCCKVMAIEATAKPASAWCQPLQARPRLRDLHHATT
ncbi:hypothetical protein [Bradyrhizobium guangxiense]|nr:hypothetical protein [Bradyrhizobium guangxiense]